MAVWAKDWRDQIWMKFINLILFCFNKVQKSISWNLPGFKMYKYSQNYYTRTRCFTKRNFCYIFIHQVKNSSTFIFLAPIQQMSNKWFLNKIHNISKQIEFAKTWFFTCFNRSVLLDCSFSYVLNYHFLSHFFQQHYQINKFILDPSGL